jgi:hypothetical protein
MSRLKLNLIGTNARQKHRPDAGEQPASLSLDKVLWYMRLTLNT